VSARRVATTPKADGGLVGQFFHSLNEQGEVTWQGYVVSNPEPGWYLLQLFEWFTGSPSVRRIMRIEDMAAWLFYPNEEAMQFAYEHGAARDRGPRGKPVAEAAT